MLTPGCVVIQLAAEVVVSMTTHGSRQPSRRVRGEGAPAKNYRGMLIIHAKCP